MGERFSTWQQITVDKLLAYMGMMILMEIAQPPSIRDYWQKSAAYHYMPVASRITRNRLCELRRYLHFVDNATLLQPGTPGYNKLGKIRPILTMLSERLVAVYNPAKEIGVGEAMIPFKGRSSLKQYLPLKPIKRGIKVWMRDDAENVFVSAFEVYTGKKGNTVEKNVGSNVVKSLTKDHKHTYRHVYYDNFFASINLAQDLHWDGLYTCATLRTNTKGFPKVLKAPAKQGLEERGENVTVQNGDLTVTVWQDSRPVVLLATNSDPTTTQTVKGKKRDGTFATYNCPSSLTQYKHYMGGVDHNDQLRSYYHVRLKCRKYYKYIFCSCSICLSPTHTSCTNYYHLYLAVRRYH